MSQPSEAPERGANRPPVDKPEPPEFEDIVDEQSAESFPASDSPSFTPGSHYGMRRTDTKRDAGRSQA